MGTSIIDRKPLLHQGEGDIQEVLMPREAWMPLAAQEEGIYKSASIVCFDPPHSNPLSRREREFIEVPLNCLLRNHEITISFYLVEHATAG